MFKPKYSYTEGIVNNLVEISSAREVILNSYLVPKWEVSLRKEALIRSAHASTSIEGNPLSLEEVSLLAQGRKVTAMRKAKQEVLNYLHVLENIDKYATDGKITEDVILKLHKDVTKETLEHPDHVGKYRNIQVYVGNKLTGTVVFTPPKAEHVPEQMKEFLDWLNSVDSQKTNSLIVAGITHYEFVRIHPFVDGNGRTARALATLILCLRGFDIKRFFALDDYYDGDRPAYYNALNLIDQTTLDLTGWLQYFTDGVLLSTKQVKERILKLSVEKNKKDQKGQIALTNRQMKIIEHMQKEGRITATDAAKMFKITRQAALKELNKLASMKVIKLKGEKRGAHYILD
jgi:Fic family protein